MSNVHWQAQKKQAVGQLDFHHPHIKEQVHNNTHQSNLLYKIKPRTIRLPKVLFLIKSQINCWTGLRLNHKDVFLAQLCGCYNLLSNDPQGKDVDL
jgi:hypothetical protein